MACFRDDIFFLHVLKVDCWSISVGCTKPMIDYDMIDTTFKFGSA